MIAACTHQISVMLVRFSLLFAFVTVSIRASGNNNSPSTQSDEEILLITLPDDQVEKLLELRDEQMLRDFNQQLLGKRAPMPMMNGGMFGKRSIDTNNVEVSDNYYVKRAKMLPFNGGMFGKRSSRVIPFNGGMFGKRSERIARSSMPFNGGMFG